jgi:hypothetical protein
MNLDMREIINLVEGKTALGESAMVLTMRPLRGNHRILSRLNVLTSAGIAADTGDRNPETDIVINSNDKEEALSILQDNGYVLGSSRSMNVTEGSDESTHDEQIAAIGQLIADRTEDENSPSKLSTDAFINLVNKMGLPLTKETLMDLVEKGTLGSVLKDVNMDEVHFKGQGDIDNSVMNVDRAKNVVANMAKRSAKKSLKRS